MTNIAKIARITNVTKFKTYTAEKEEAKKGPVTQSFQIARKILVTFAIFAKFADFSKPFLTFPLVEFC